MYSRSPRFIPGRGVEAGQAPSLPRTSPSDTWPRGARLRGEGGREPGRAGTGPLAPQRPHRPRRPTAAPAAAAAAAQVSRPPRGTWEWRVSGGVEVAVGDLGGRLGAEVPDGWSRRKRQPCSLHPSPSPHPPGFICEFGMDCLAWDSSVFGVPAISSRVEISFQSAVPSSHFLFALPAPKYFLLAQLLLLPLPQSLAQYSSPPPVSIPVAELVWCRT